MFGAELENLPPPTAKVRCAGYRILLEYRVVGGPKFVLTQTLRVDICHSFTKTLDMSSLAKRWGVDTRPGDRRCTEDEGQLTLDRAKTLGRGGRRENAGRPKKERVGGRTEVPHEARPEHRASTPVHVTLRRVKDLPSFRLAPLYDVILGCIRDTQTDDFRIVHYSVQANHIHLIVEASAGRLERGINGFAVRAARRLNVRVLSRRGSLWEGRFHRHDLRTPREVRHALVYVLANGVKHNEVERGTIDPCSSGLWFDGWISGLPTSSAPSPVRAAETWLLRTGWTKVYPGYLLPSEAPKAMAPKK